MHYTTIRFYIYSSRKNLCLQNFRLQYVPTRATPHKPVLFQNYQMFSTSLSHQQWPATCNQPTLLTWLPPPSTSTTIPIYLIRTTYYKQLFRKCHVLSHFSYFSLYIIQWTDVLNMLQNVLLVSPNRYWPIGLLSLTRPHTSIDINCMSYLFNLFKPHYWPDSHGPNCFFPPLVHSWL